MIQQVYLAIANLEKVGSNNPRQVKRTNQFDISASRVLTHIQLSSTSFAAQLDMGHTAEEKNLVSALRSISDAFLARRPRNAY